MQFKTKGKLTGTVTVEMHTTPIGFVSHIVAADRGVWLQWLLLPVLARIHCAHWRSRLARIHCLMYHGCLRRVRGISRRRIGLHLGCYDLFVQKFRFFIHYNWNSNELVCVLLVLTWDLGKSVRLSDWRFAKSAAFLVWECVVESLRRLRKFQSAVLPIFEDQTEHATKHERRKKREIQL